MSVAGGFLSDMFENQTHPGPAAIVSPENLLDIQILGTHHKRTESETLGVSPAICVLMNFPGHSDSS